MFYSEPETVTSIKHGPALFVSFHITMNTPAPAIVNILYLTVIPLDSKSGT